jgi:hypothetical protein
MEKREGVRRARPRQQNCLLLALTFVTFIIVILIIPDAVTALIIISILLGFTIACNSSMGGDAGKQCPHAAKEGFYYLPGQPAPYAILAPSPDASPGRYLGAFDADEFDTFPGLGHHDRTELDNVSASDGNPFNLSRISAPHAAEACIDDEANADELDGDERINYQMRSRNDPSRVAAGTMNRSCDLDKYLREEVEEESDREWWGRHEY